MRVGDIIPAALWYNPDHPSEYETAKEGIEDAIRLLADEEGFLIAPVKYEILDWDDSRLPEPPKHMHNGVKCLLGEAEVVARKPGVRINSFLADLDPVDLERLRAITRREHKRARPHEPDLTDEQCDVLIDAIGPDSATRMVRQAVDRGYVN